MDVFSLVGIILVFVVIVGGNFFEGGYVGVLFNGLVVLIVIGGILVVVLLQILVNVFKCGLGMFGWVFFLLCEDFFGGIDWIVFWSMIVCKEGLFGLESIVDVEFDFYVCKGL